MSLYSEFEEAARELDSLTAAGFFGETAKQLMLRRDHVEAHEHLYNCFLDWVNDKTQYGKENVAHLIFLFLKLYTDAWKVKGQDTVDVLVSLFKGTPDRPDLECTSAYTEYLRTHVEFKNLIREFKGRVDASVSERKKLASALIGAYAKGVEFVGKILTRLLALVQIVNGEPYDLIANTGLTLAKKTERFLAFSQGRYDILVNRLDRDIRNAEAHLSLYFNTNENIYVVRKINAKGKKQKPRKITPEAMMTEIYPYVGWISQAFVYSAVILFLAHENGDHFRESMKTVQEIGRSNYGTLL